jgi:hypothetical protein
MQTYLGFGSMKECFLLFWSTDLLKSFFVTNVVPEVMTKIFHALVIREIIIATANLLSLNSTVILFFGRFPAFFFSAFEKYNYSIQNKYLNNCCQSAKSEIFFSCCGVSQIFSYFYTKDFIVSGWTKHVSEISEITEAIISWINSPKIQNFQKWKPMYKLLVGVNYLLLPQ